MSGRPGPVAVGSDVDVDVGGDDILVAEKSSRISVQGVSVWLEVNWHHILPSRSSRSSSSGSGAGCGGS